MELLNEIVKGFIDESELESIEELNFISRLVDIVEKYPIEIKNISSKTKVNINKSFKYSYNFFKELDQDYADYLLYIKDKGVFDIVLNKEEYPYSSMKNGKHYIYLPIWENIGDTYSITHETIHDMSLEEDKLSYTRHMFCEVMAMEAEMLQRDYFSKTIRPKGYNLNNLSILSGLLSRKNLTKIELRLLQTYLKYGYIDKQRFFDTFDDIDGNDLEESVEYIMDIEDRKDLNYDYNQRYLIGYIFASYMHDRIINDSKKTKEFIELNDNINSFSIEDFITYLDLDYEGDYFINLTEDSYKKLEKSYVNELKRR